jgi:hypothetical protein
MLMQRIGQGVLAVFFTLLPAITFAQAGTPATTATDVSTNEVSGGYEEGDPRVASGCVSMRSPYQPGGHG